MSDNIKIRCFRYDPAEGREPYFQEYDVPREPDGMSVQDCLNYIRENLDAGLAYFVNCKLGFCLRCNLRMNGKVVLACETLAEPEMTLEPVNRESVLRDLWCEST